MTKTLNIQKYIDESIKDMLELDNNGTNNIAKVVNEHIREIMLKHIENTTDNLVLGAFGISRHWNEWEFRDPEKFAETKIGAYMLGPMQDLIIERVKKVNVDAVVVAVERAMSKKLHDMTETLIDDAFKRYIDEKLANHVEQRLKTMMDKKLTEMVRKSVDKPPKPAKQKPTKRAPKKPLLV